jgi:hypothetical protein
MAVRRVQLRRGTTAENNAFTGAIGEVTVDTTTESIRVHNGADAGGADLLRADMSNNASITSNIGVTGSIVIGPTLGANTITLGQANSIISIPGTLNVTTQNTTNDLLVQDRVIVLADGSEGNAHDANGTNGDSIGIIFTRPLQTDGEGGGAQNPGVFYFDEENNYFALGTADVTENDNSWNADFTSGTLSLGSLNVNEGNITNVGDIALDSISADNNTISISLTDNQASSLDITEGANSYLKFVTTDEGEKVVFGKVFESVSGSAVGTLTLADGSITDSGGAISFGDENLSTTGTLGAGVATLASGSTVGTLTLADGSITDSGGSISFGDENLSTSGTLGAGATTVTSLSVTDGNITNVGDISLDSISADGNAISISLTDNQESSLDITEGVNSYLKFVTTDAGEKVVFGKVSEGVSGSTVGTLTLADGSITDSGGAISFGDENLSTTGTLGAGVATLASGSTVGTLTLADGSITDSGGAISFGNENLSTTGTLGAGATTVTSLSVTDGNITNVGDIALDSISADGSTLTITLTDNEATALNITEAGNSYLNFVTTNEGEKVVFGKVSEGVSGSTVGTLTLADGSITDSGGAISFGNENLSTTGTLGVGSATVTSLSVTDGNITNVGDVALDSISADGNTISISLTDAQATALDITEGVNSYLKFVTTDADEKVVFGKVSEGVSGSSVGNLTLADGSITDSGGAISFGDENLSTTGTLGSGATTVTSLSVTDGDITNVGDIALDSISADGDTLTISLTDAQATALDITEGANSYLKFVTTDADEKVVFGKVSEGVSGSSVGTLTIADGSITDSGGSISFGDENLSTTGTLGAGVATLASGSTVGTLTLADGSITSTGGTITFDDENLTTTGSITCTNITVNGTQTIISTTNLSVADQVIELNKDIGDNNNNSDIGIFLNRGLEDDALIIWDEGEGKFLLGTHSGAVNGTTTDFSGVVGLSKAGLLVSTLEATGTVSGATGSTFGDLTLADGSITDSSGAISFGDENLSTTGTLGAGATTVTSLSVTDGDISNVGDIALDSISADGNTISISLTDNQASSLDITEGANSYLKFVTTDADEKVVFGKVSEGVSGSSVGTLTLADGSITDSGGAVSFGDENLSTTGTLGAGATTVTSLSVADGDISNVGDIALDSISADGNSITLNLTDNQASSLDITEGANSYLKFVTTDADEKVVFGKVSEGVSGSTVGTLTLADGSITDSGGAISFGNENLSTTGTLGAGSATVTSLSVTDGDITNVGDIALDSISADGNAITLNLTDNQASSLDITEGVNSYLKFVTTDAGEKVVFGKVSEGVSGSTVGTLTLADGSITDSSGAISFGDENLSTTGTLGAGATTVTSLSVADGDITNVGDISLDSISADGNTISISLTDAQATALDIAEGANSYLKFVTTNEGEKVVFGKVSEGVSGSSVGTLTLADGSITDSGGVISFGDENLSTTGSLTSNSLTVSGGGVALGDGSNATSISVTTQTDEDTVGENLTISSGVGNGTGTGGSVIFQTGGDNAGALSTVLTLSSANKATFTGEVETGSNLILGNNVIQNSDGETTITLTADQKVTLSGDLDVTGVITGNSAVSGSLRFKDPTLYVGYTNTASTRDLGFVGAYGDSNFADFLMGVVYEVDNTVGGKSGAFKIFHGRADITEPAASYSVPDSDLAPLDVGSLNVKNGGLTVAKTTGLTGDEGVTNAPLFSTNTKAFQVAVTTDTAIADDAHSIGFVVNNTSVLSTSVIMATVASADNGGDILAEGGIEVYAHSITNATSFEFSLVNRIGSQINADSVITINFVIL